jgi:hypothetical protein
MQRRAAARLCITKSTAKMSDYNRRNKKAGFSPGLFVSAFAQMFFF